MFVSSVDVFYTTVLDLWERHTASCSALLSIVDIELNASFVLIRSTSGSDRAEAEAGERGGGHRPQEEGPARGEEDQVRQGSIALVLRTTGTEDDQARPAADEQNSAQAAQDPGSLLGRGIHGLDEGPEGRRRGGAGVERQETCPDEEEADIQSVRVLNQEAIRCGQTVEVTGKRSCPVDEQDDEGEAVSQRARRCSAASVEGGCGAWTADGPLGASHGQRHSEDEGAPEGASNPAADDLVCRLDDGRGRPRELADQVYGWDGSHASEADAPPSQGDDRLGGVSDVVAHGNRLDKREQRSAALKVRA